MLKYIDIYGWPYSGYLPDDAQQVLDACVWYYNRIWHKGINAIPYEVFHAYDLNRQKLLFTNILYILLEQLLLENLLEWEAMCLLVFSILNQNHL
jgi:hypothetical protein